MPRAGARPLCQGKAPEPGFVPGWSLCTGIPSAEPRVGFGCSLLSGAGNGTARRLQAPAAPKIPWIYCCWHHPGRTGSHTGNLPRDRGGQAALTAQGYNSLFFWAALSILALEEGGFRALPWDKSCCSEVSQEYVFFLFFFKHLPVGLVGKWDVFPVLRKTIPNAMSCSEGMREQRGLFCQLDRLLSSKYGFF